MIEKMRYALGLHLMGSTVGTRGEWIDGHGGSNVNFSADKGSSTTAIIAHCYKKSVALMRTLLKGRENAFRRVSPQTTAYTRWHDEYPCAKLSETYSWWIDWDCRTSSTSWRLHVS